MRKLSLIVCILLASMRVLAVDVDYRLSLRGAMTMPDGKVDVTVGQKGSWIGPSLGGEFAVTFHPEWAALRQWNNAAIGVALNYWYMGDAWYKKDLGGREMLGHAISPYVFLDIPFYKSPHFAVGVRAGVGLNLMTKTYRNTVPEDHLYKDLENSNRSIGSVINYSLPETFYLEAILGKGWSLALEGGWQHMSNGSMVQPNSGYNMLWGGLSAKYTPVERQDNQVGFRAEEGALKKNWEIEMAVAGGARQVYYRDQQTFGCAEIMLSAYWRAHPIFRLGGGVDVFYDGAYMPRDTYFGKTNLKLAKADGSDCWRLGVSIQPEFVVGKFSVGFHLGAYLLDPVKELEPYDKNATLRYKRGIFYSYDFMNAGSAGYADGWVYTQVIMRYRLPYHILLQLGMKAHITKVEFVHAGIGWYL